jgi:hypothetical protein
LLRLIQAFEPQLEFVRNDDLGCHVDKYNPQSIIESTLYFTEASSSQ